MSDLLTRLAQRALGTAARAVQPRLPSRYADAPGDPAPSILSEEAAEAEPFAPRIPSPRPAPAVAHPSPMHPASPHPAPVLRRAPDAVHPPRDETVPRADAPAAEKLAAPRDVHRVPASTGIERIVERVDDAPRPHPAPSATSRSAESTASSAARSGDADPPAHPASAAPLVETRGRTAEHGLQPVHTVVEAGEDDGLLMPRPKARPRPPTLRGEDAESRPAPLAAGRVRETGDASVEVVKVAESSSGDAERGAESAVPPSPAGRGSVVRAEGVRVAERTAPPAAEARTDERPVVRVTIGRIEVRAAPPPPQPQPAARAGWKPPVLSLDDYLKREAGR